MSTNTKVVMWILIAVVVVGGIWWWFSMSPTAVSPATNPVTDNQAGQNQNQPQPQTNGVSATDNSNIALQTDLSNVDSQMNGFSSDNASVDQGLSDQPVPQQQL